MRAALYGLALCALGSAGCGDDEPPPPARKPASTQAKQQATSSGPAVPVIAYRRVEERVTADEKKAIRHQFREDDFTPDLTGTDNRDPFRSFVVAQPGVGVTGGPTPEATDACPKKRQFATSYSARELDLVGIVARGTIRYALYSDTAHYGYVVRSGDCLGKEKARVKEIGASFVTLEISQETPPNQPPRPAEQRTIQLHPKELPIGESGEQEGVDDRGMPADLRRRSDELLRGDRSLPPTEPAPPSPARPPDTQ